MHFHCSRIDGATQQSLFPTHRPSRGYTFSQVSAKLPTLRLVQCSAPCPTPLLPEALPVQRSVDLGIDFKGIGISFDIVNCQYWCFLLNCLFKSLSRRRDHGCGHVFELECPILPSESKFVSLRECWRLDQRSVSASHRFKFSFSAALASCASRTACNCCSACCWRFVTTCSMFVNSSQST